MLFDNIPPTVNLQHTLKKHSDVIFRIAWSPDGKFIASPSRDTTIKIWDGNTGEIYRDLQGHTLRVNSVSWSKDSQQLVSCASDGVVALWDLRQSSTKINQIKKITKNGEVIPVFDIAWASNSGLLAAACKDGNVRLWGLESNSPVKNLAAINAYINCVAWSPDEKYLAAGSGDKKIRVWEVNKTGDPKLVWEVDAHYSPVNSIAWSPDGRLLASGGKQRLKIWDVFEQKLFQEIEVQSNKDGFVKSVGFSHNGNLLAAKCQNSQIEQNNEVKILDATTLQIVAGIPEPTTAKAENGIAFHPLLPILATQGEDDTVLRIWDLAHLTSQNLEPTTVNSITRKKALVVGIDRYQNIASELHTCAADAEAIAHFLQASGWQLQVLLNEKATIDTLKTALQQLFQPLEGVAPESALFYFSGLGAGVEGYSWGMRVQPEQKGGLVAYDSAVNTSLSLSWLYDLLRTSPVKKQLVWLDSDYSGLFIEIARQDSSIAPSDRCLIASSQQNELAIDQSSSDGKENGVFSAALLNLLNSRLSSSDGAVTNRDLEALNGSALPSGQHPIVFNAGQPFAIAEKQLDETPQTVYPNSSLDRKIPDPEANPQEPISSSVKTAIPPWIFGMHDPGDWRDLVEQAGKKAWVMFNQVVGHDARNLNGSARFIEWERSGYGVLVRLVNAPFSAEKRGGGSIPLRGQYENFAQRCANFVQNSPGCRVWFIGEEMNISWHWPSNISSTSQPISPGEYADCFKLVRDAIKQVQPGAWVIPSGLNPLKHPNVAHEDALQWFGNMLELMTELDGFDIHSYFPARDSYNYKEFLQKIPANKRHLPVFLTEATPPDVWSVTANGWMLETYRNVDEWNTNPDNQKIYAVLPYRWQETLPDGTPDPWNLIDKPAYRQDFSEVLKNDYRWNVRFQTPSNLSGDTQVEKMPTSSENSLATEQSVDTSLKLPENEDRGLSSNAATLKKSHDDQDESSTSSETAIPHENTVSIEPSNRKSVSLPKDKVEQIQTLLTQAGHSVAIDGNYGKQTQTAIQQVQEELGVHTTHIFTPSFIQLLKLQPPPPNDTIKIEIGADTVSLDLNGNEYSNPNLLAQYADALSVAEQKADWATYGELLFEAIINDIRNEQGVGSSVRTGYRTVKEQISSQRLRMELDLDPNRMRLHEYKWEYLKDPRDEVPVAVYEHSPFYRCPKNDNNRDPIEAKPLKILVVICNPSTLKDPSSPGTVFSPAALSTANHPVEQLVKIDVAQEKAILKIGLQRLQEEGLIEYVFLDESENGPRITLDNLITELRERPYHILHIVAHGFLMGDSFMLVMESQDGRHDCVDAKRFNPPMFPDSLRLVVLASCQTAQTDSDNVIRGLGARLSNLGVPAVVAMQDLVPIPTAQLFTQYFYDHLARSGRIDMAMAATRYDLYRRREGDTGDWGIPVLFMNSKCGQLFEVDRQKACTVDPLRPEVKSYDQLPGRGDPRPQVLASSLESLARQHNLNPEQIALLSSLAASLRPNTAPLAPPQNRLELQEKIKKDLKLKPIEPGALEKAATLSLPFHVYGQIASALNTGKHIILIGSPGTGKTTIAHDICEYVKYRDKTGDHERQEGWSAGYTSTTATADWTTFDTIGGYVPTPQQTLQFRPGIFLQAIAQGNWLVIDEINRSDIDKSFGELFTVLSGQQVDLPYTINDQSVSILPAKAWDAHKNDQPDNYTYVIHPNWRVIGTMNVYDKSSLFNLSFAFMRRFAFIEVDVPDHQIYQHNLLTDRDKGWFTTWKQEKRKAEILESLQLKLLDLLRLNDVDDVTLLKDLELTINPLMSCRAIGPAIIKDMVDYIGDRYQPGEDIINCLGEAFLLYLSPQLDGIGQDEILKIHYFVGSLFKEKTICSSILNRIELFYPHIRGWQR